MDRTALALEVLKLVTPKSLTQQDTVLFAEKLLNWVEEKGQAQAPTSKPKKSADKG